ncbi:mannitol dehydrogenase family protein [Tessaracoccus antarcticus]|nr:mannitol dehydrogenase family protein [Tessaracoccus antarcticus]
MASIPEGVRRPAVDPAALSIGIVHFGIGAFHRSHQAVYTEDAAAATGETGWGILGVTGRSDTVAAQLRAQDCLYGVLEKGAAATSLRIIGSVREAVWPGRDSERVVEALAQPSTHIATLTITEKGYPRAGDGSIDLGRAAVQHDLGLIEAELVKTESPEAASIDDSALMSQTPIGLLVRGLARRFRRHREPFTVVPCDNLVENGTVVRTLVTSLVAAIGSSNSSEALTRARESFGEWMEDSVAFPSTMVDRIAPAVTDADRDEAFGLLGLRDEALVVAEPFIQWVIEDRFAGPRPAWEVAGAILTGDVAPYERAKLRILNATHSVLAYCGALKGYATIAESVADDVLRRRARAIVDDDILPTLESPPGMDLQQYRDEVLERFANPALAHTTRQVAMDGSQKLPSRMLGTASDRLTAGHVPHGMAFAVAAWIAFVSHALESGETLDDPLADTLLSSIGSTDALQIDPRGVVERLFAIRQIFPEDIAGSSLFVDAVVTQLAEVRGATHR